MTAFNFRCMELERQWEATRPSPPPVGETLAQIQRAMDEAGDAKEQVFSEIDRMRDDAVEFLRSLVKIPSVNPSEQWEKPLADYLAREFRTMGMSVDQIEPQPGRVSNVARLEGAGREGRTLLFDSHLDTVPPGDEAAWRFPPFSATVWDGKVFGRGAKDCKLGIASSVIAVRALQSCGIRLKGTVLISTTADEETGGHLGIHKLIEEGLIKADWAVYGEGMPDKVVIGHKGLLQIRITTRGVTAHTSRKSRAVNAILKMSRVIPAIDSLDVPGVEPHPIVPGPPVASVNMISGGFKENVIPDRCSIVVDIRFPPTCSVQQIMGAVNRTLDDLKRSDGHLGGMVFDPVEPLVVARASSISPEEPVVKYLQACVQDVLGVYPKAEGMEATSDSRWILLDAGIPIVNYSLGNESGHSPNEYVAIEDYIRNIKVYALMALVSCRPA
ncbi:MAG: ArgE/DapE family deacylase [Firmicutes bacterium]|nr:ArgE/DapE family deacylase [Bacillota bacterium]